MLQLSSGKQETSRSPISLSGEGHSHHHVMFTKGICQKTWHACLTHLRSLLPGYFRWPPLCLCQHCCLNKLTYERIVSEFSYSFVGRVGLIHRKLRKTDWVVRCWLGNTVTEVLLAWTWGEIDWPMRITEDWLLPSSLVDCNTICSH